ncbi:hypothetical protein SDC9_146405 [bioreactor metagenome]|uniref:Uncharacterized protein n=1 Tax=bioreactor metagenome TaxID=1076179 RepID=A0A645EAX1_9ZZZZ
MLYGRQVFHGLGAGEEFSSPQAGLAGQRVIHLEADAVERRIQQLVRGHHKGQRLGQMRCVVQQRGALVQRLAHQGDVALRQIAHAAMHQLGGARGSALGEVQRLQQHDLEAARRRIHRHAQPRGTAAHDGQIEAFGLRQALQQLCTRCSQGLSGLVHGTTSAVIAVPPPSRMGRTQRRINFRSNIFALFRFLWAPTPEYRFVFARFKPEPLLQRHSGQVATSAIGALAHTQCMNCILLAVPIVTAATTHRDDI